jgi:glycosyltransferase involved in cell wall biosynthesis
MSRRLLLLTYFYPPLAGGGVYRALGFTRWLPEHGWDCTVVCAGAGDYWVRDESLLARVPPGIEVIRVPGGSGLAMWLRLVRGLGPSGSPAAGRRSGAVFGGLRTLSDWTMIPDSYAGWARRARRAAARRLERGDVDALLSTSPPDSVHLAAAPLAVRFGLPWVADFRDPWIGLHFRRPPTAWHRARQRGLHDRVLGSADLVLAATRTHAEDLARNPALEPRRLVHLPNGFEPDPDASVPARRDPEHFTLVFTGTLSHMADAETLFEALHALFARRPEARRRIRVRIAGPFDAEYEDRALALGLKGIVEFSGPIPHAEARALQRAADALLLWSPRGYRTNIPGKVYEYLDSGRPVLALLDPRDEVAALVRRAGAVCLGSGDRDGLADEIERRYLAWKAGGEPAPPGRPDWLDEHTRSRLTARLAALLDRLEPRDRRRVSTGGPR